MTYLLHTLPIFAMTLVWTISQNAPGFAGETSDPTQEQKTSDILHSAYETAQEKLNQDDGDVLSIEDRILSEELNSLAVIPQEETIEDFPSPLDPSETDPATLSEYYAAVAEAYFVAALEVGQHQNQIETQLAHTKQNQGIEIFRTQDQRLEARSLTHNKDFLFGRKTPSRIEKHIHPRISQSAQTNLAQNAITLNRNQKRLTMKGTFYATMAMALLPHELFEEKEEEEE